MFLFMYTEVDKKKMARNEWYRMSENMMKALSDIAKNNPAITPEQHERWSHSTTHNEVVFKIIGKVGSYHSRFNCSHKEILKKLL